MKKAKTSFLYMEKILVGFDNNGNIASMRIAFYSFKIIFENFHTNN